MVVRIGRPIQPHSDLLLRPRLRPDAQNPFDPAEWLQCEVARSSQLRGRLLGDSLGMQYQDPKRLILGLKCKVPVVVGFDPVAGGPEVLKTLVIVLES